MLSKKSPQTSCRIRIRNDRIGANGFLNQRCALAPDLESILRARMSKIVFRQHRPTADIHLVASASSAGGQQALRLLTTVQRALQVRTPVQVGAVELH